MFEESNLAADKPKRIEQKPLPEVITGQEVANLVSDLQKRCSPLFGRHLVESNIVLTLSALKAQTEFFIETESDEDIEQIQADVDILNEYLDSNNIGIRFKNIGKPKTDTACMIGVFNLAGYERVSRMTKIPGVEPYDSSQGWDNWLDWVKTLDQKLEQAQAEGKIPKEYMISSLGAGLVKGYPDQANYDFADALSKTGELQDKFKNMISSNIPHVGTYEEAEPDYDFYTEHTDDQIIRTNIEQAGAVLKGFYESEWHKNLKKGSDR